MSAITNEAAEAVLIGAMFQWPEPRRHLAELAAEDFEQPQARDCFNAIASLTAQRAGIDFLTVGAEAQRMFGHDVRAYLLECSRRCPTGVNSASYARMVAEASRRRTLYHGLRSAADKLLQATEDVDAAVENARQALAAMRRAGRAVTLADALGAAYEGTSRAARGEGGAISTGIGLLDHLTGGLHPTQLAILGARPGVGKSALGMEIALNAAGKGKRVLICSLEMSSDEYAQRVMARKSGVSLRAIRSGTEVGDQQWEALGDALNDGAKLPVEFTFDVSTPERLRGVVEASAPDLVVVDYLQLLDTRRRYDGNVDRLRIISGALKGLARDCGVAVLALAQVTRSGQRGAVMPVLSDLRGSGDLEQDADVVLFLHQPDNPDDDFVSPKHRQTVRDLLAGDGQRFVVVNVAKQRQGEVGAFPLIFEPSRMSFSPAPG